MITDDELKRVVDYSLSKDCKSLLVELKPTGDSMVNELRKIKCSSIDDALISLFELDERYNNAN